MSTSDRPDISEFRPSNTQLRSEGEMIEQLVSAIGGSLVNRFHSNSEQDRLENISNGQRLAENIRSKLDIRSRYKHSIALVDWSAVNRTYKLLCGENDLADPFVALADFSSILNACIFYDKVVFIDDGQLAHKINTAMNLDKVFVPLSINEFGSPFEQLLDAHLSWAFNYFDSETQKNAHWLTWLADSWKYLLPGTIFPKHSANAFGDELKDISSLNRRLWRDIIHQAQNNTWELNPLDSNNLILDNDIRALCQERLAQTIDAAVSKESESFTRYVGGCLRSPLQIARARYAEACLDSSPISPLWEKWLLDEWVKKYPAKDQRLEQAVRIPFWAGAIFARCNGNAEKLPTEITKCRNQAAVLRTKRAELEKDLQQSRIGNLSSLSHAVRGEMDRLVTWVESGAKMAGQIGGTVTSAFLKAHAPIIPNDVLNQPITKMAEAMGGSSWLKKLALKLYRPHVYFVFTLSQDASQIENVLQAAAQVLPIGGKDVVEPTAFLSRLSRLRTEWHI